MRTKKLETIVCPRCGREYLPAEIFMPKSFLGKPVEITKDFSGKIINYFGSSMDTNETYTCDGCNTTFKVTARVSFTSAPTKIENFEEEYSCPIKKNNLFFNENT